jgi:hypothetical protein
VIRYLGLKVPLEIAREAYENASRVLNLCGRNSKPNKEKKNTNIVLEA